MIRASTGQSRTIRRAVRFDDFPTGWALRAMSNLDKAFHARAAHAYRLLQIVLEHTGL
jgi:hypothetical protein